MKRNTRKVFSPADATIIYGKVSSSLYASFGKSFLSKFNLIEMPKRKSFHEPVVYFGCYKPEDVLSIQSNRSDFKIIIYGGTDATKKNNLIKLKDVKNLHHVAISKYISNDLKKVGIKHTRLGVTPVDHSMYKIRPVPLGDSIYIYMNSEKKANIYGKEIYTKIMKKFPDIKFILCGFKSHSREELIKIYKKCFIGLRLIDHDGLSNTVIEMGLMGRYNIHNGGTPASLSYRNINDICRHIKNEQKKIGITQIDLSKRVKKHITLPKDWLNKRFWKK